jgi:hypothetical protein
MNADAVKEAPNGVPRALKLLSEIASTADSCRALCVELREPGQEQVNIAAAAERLACLIGWMADEAVENLDSAQHRYGGTLLDWFGAEVYNRDLSEVEAPA